MNKESLEILIIDDNKADREAVRRALPALHELLQREELAPLHGVITAAVHRIERSSPASAGTGP